MIVHELKTDPVYFSAIGEGRKKFDIRINDRNYQVGDEIWFQETYYSCEEMKQGLPLRYTGRIIAAEITYIMTGPIFGLAGGWAILSIELV